MNTPNQSNQMTYKELLLQLQQLNEEQLNSGVCVYDTHKDYHRLVGVELVYSTDEECIFVNLNHPIISF